MNVTVHERRLCGARRSKKIRKWRSSSYWIVCGCFRGCVGQGTRRREQQRGCGSRARVSKWRSNARSKAVEIIWKMISRALFDCCPTQDVTGLQCDQVIHCIMQCFRLLATIFHVVREATTSSSFDKLSAPFPHTQVLPDAPVHHRALMLCTTPQ